MSGLPSDTLRLSGEAQILTSDHIGLNALGQALQSKASLRADAGSQICSSVEDTQSIYVQTSGSTGAPKIIQRSAQSWINSFAQDQLLFDITPQDRIATLGALSHSLSLYGACMALHLGCGIAALDGCSPRRQIAALSDHNISILYATPTQLGLLLKAGLTELPNLRLILCGGGFLSEALRTDLAHALPHTQIVGFFGASETSYVTICDDQTPVGSVGRAYPNVDIRIGNSNAPNTIGEIWIKSPYLFDRYCSAHHADWDGGYLSIGEMGALDQDGYLTLAGRKSRMVNIADQCVYPEAIEDLLNAHETVQQAIILPIKDPDRGHHLVAIIQGHFDEKELRRLCRQHLGAPHIPHKFVAHNAIPLLKSGKPDIVAIEHWWSTQHA